MITIMATAGHIIGLAAIKKNPISQSGRAIACIDAVRMYDHGLNSFNVQHEHILLFVYIFQCVCTINLSMVCFL